MTPLFVGPKMSDVVMAGKHPLSPSESVHLRRETVHRLGF